MGKIENDETIGESCYVSFKSIINNARPRFCDENADPELDKAAKGLMSIYKSYRRAGFNDKQAMCLLAAGVSAAVLEKK